MAIRYLKILLIFFVALQGTIYALQNLFNWDAAWQFVATVMAMMEQPFYHSFMPSITSHSLVSLTLIIIILGELSAGLFGFWGTVEMLRARKESVQSFNKSKSKAIFGAGMAVIVWFGFFMVMGNTLFQMWQTQIGQGVMAGAFQYGSVSMLILIFVAMHDAEL